MERTRSSGAASEGTCEGGEGGAGAEDVERPGPPVAGGGRVVAMSSRAPSAAAMQAHPAFSQAASERGPGEGDPPAERAGRRAGGTRPLGRGRDDAGGGAQRRRQRGARSRMPLEDALAAHVRSLAGAGTDEGRLHVLLERLGLRGRPPLTLKQAGERLGLSAERVRQLETRLRERQRRVGLRGGVPELDDALATVRAALPLPAGDVERLLVEAGVTARPFGVRSLVCAAEFLGREVPFVVGAGDPEAVLLPAGLVSLPDRDTVLAVARAQVDRHGASSYAELAHELAARSVTLSRDALATVLESAGAAVAGDEWFWFPGRGTARAFAQSSLRMLAVTTPLPVASLRDGLRRHSVPRGHRVLPPVAVLHRVYQDHPAFDVDDGGSVRPATPVDTEALLGDVNRRLVSILRAAPGGFLDRGSLLEASRAAGLNASSISFYLCYSECIERVGVRMYAPRGAQVDPCAVAAREEALGSRDRRHPELWVGWTATGDPFLVTDLTSSTAVRCALQVPAALRSVLQGRRFAPATAGGRGTSEVLVDRHGQLWGWSDLVQNADAEPGDVVRATFRMARGTVDVEVGGADLPDRDERSLAPSS